MKSFVLLLLLCFLSAHADEEVEPCETEANTFGFCLFSQESCDQACFETYFTEQQVGSRCEAMQAALCCCPPCADELSATFQCELDQTGAECELMCVEPTPIEPVEPEEPEEPALPCIAETNKAVTDCFAANFGDSCSLGCNPDTTVQDEVCLQWTQIECCCPACADEMLANLQCIHQDDAVVESCEPDTTCPNAPEAPSTDDVPEPPVVDEETPVQEDDTPTEEIPTQEDDTPEAPPAEDTPVEETPAEPTEDESKADNGQTPEETTSGENDAPASEPVAQATSTAAAVLATAFLLVGGMLL